MRYKEFLEYMEQNLSGHEILESVTEGIREMDFSDDAA